MQEGKLGERIEKPGSSQISVCLGPRLLEGVEVAVAGVQTVGGRLTGDFHMGQARSYITWI